METIVDIHSHILPGIDDGSACVEESISMLLEESRQGITHVTATPHFYANHDTPENFLSRRYRAEAKLRREMEKYDGLPELTVGAEVYFFRGMSESELLPQLTICGGDYIMIEMPPSPWTQEMYRELAGIWEKQGIIPIVAHVDRYISPLRTYGIPRNLNQMRVLVQANAGFFLNRSTSVLAMKMLQADQIQLLGSDCHNMTSRKPNLGPARQRIEKKLGQDVLENVHKYERMVFHP